MAADRMRLKLLLPFGVFADQPGVSRIVAETPQGSFGLWPNRLDCVAALQQGILTYECDSGDVVFVAVDAGVLVKTGSEVTVSVRRAIGGSDLAQLRDTVEREFATLDDEQRSARQAVARIEAGLMRRFARFTMTDDTREAGAGRDGHARAAGASTLAAQVDASARRKLRSRRIGPPVVWSGLGMMGMVGWSVVVPTLLGALLGLWLDQHHAGSHPWTLALLVGGLVLGCFNAGFWVAKEDKAMRDEQAAAGHN